MALAGPSNGGPLGSSEFEPPLVASGPLLVHKRCRLPEGASGGGGETSKGRLQPARKGLIQGEAARKICRPHRTTRCGDPTPTADRTSNTAQPTPTAPDRQPTVAKQPCGSKALAPGTPRVASGPPRSSLPDPTDNPGRRAAPCGQPRPLWTTTNQAPENCRHRAVAWFEGASGQADHGSVAGCHSPSGSRPRTDHRDPQTPVPPSKKSQLSTGSPAPPKTWLGSATCVVPSRMALCSCCIRGDGSTASWSTIVERRRR